MSGVLSVYRDPTDWGYYAVTEDDHDDADRSCPGRHPIDAVPLGTPMWCTACTERIHRALSGPMGIAELLALATAREDGQLLEVTRASLRVATCPDPASPSAAVDEIDECCRWAYRCAQHLAAHLGRDTTTDPDDDRRLPELTNSLSYLTRWLRPALTSPFAWDLGDAVMAVHKRLQRAAGEQEQRRRLRVPCPACQTAGLVREDGGIGVRRHPRDTDQIEVECTYCGAAWTEPGFQAALAQAS